MTCTVYTPMPGTIQAHALERLSQGLLLQTELMAEMLDQPVDLVGDALDTLFVNGLVTRERKDGRTLWSLAHGPLRPLGAPPPVCADDDHDDWPITRRVVPANPTAQETAMPATPTAAPVAPPQPPKAKKPRAAPAEFDPLAIELKPGRPLPATTRTAGPSRYQVLLGRMKPGDSVDLPPAVAKGLISAAKRAQVKLASRVISETVTGVWRLP